MLLGEGSMYCPQIIPLLLHYSTTILLSGVTLFGIACILFKKIESEGNKQLSKYEEDKIIESYNPEELVEEESENRIELKPRIVQSKVGMYLEIDGVKCFNFGCHNYLGFVGNGMIEDEAIKCISVFGVGSCGPRGFYGTTTKHTELEACLARILDLEDAIVYPFGFTTIASAIPAYAKKTDIIFVDEKINFAVRQGLAASQSTVHLFKHNDVTDLEKNMEALRLNDLKHSSKGKPSRRYLVVEGIYVNTGKICPLPEIVRVCKKYKVRIFVDESVSFGVLGKTGKGVTEYFSVPRVDVDLIMGSFEYALGSIGGFCAGARLLTDHQQMTGQGYCFSASLSPLLAAATIEALQTIERTPEILERLRSLCNALHFKLDNSQVVGKYFNVSGDKDCPIHLLFVKKEHRYSARNGALEDFVEYCLYKNIAITRTAFLDGVDPSMDVAGIRVTTSVYNSEEHIDCLIRVLEEACIRVFLS